MELTFRLACLLISFLACLLLQCHLGESRYIVTERCMCPETTLYVSEPMETFEIKEQNEFCENVEIIVTLKRDNQKVCLNPDGRQGQRMSRCWERNNKDESRKKMCIRQRK